MSENNHTTCVFTGPELAVNLLKNELEQIGVGSIIKNGFNSGIIAGFAGGLASAIDLYIQESDIEKAEQIIADFIKRNNG
jgi:hypothetical protein